MLRKTGRLGDGDSDTDVWDRLALRTLDGIAVSPLGTPQLVEDLATSGRPDRAGDWDIRAHLTGSDPKRANEAALVDLDNGVTSLWLQGARRHRPRRPSSTRCCSTSPQSSSTASPPAPSSRTPTAARSTRPPTWASPQARPPGKRPNRPSTPACSASSSTRPGSTTAAPPTRRSWPGRWPPARRTSAPLSTPASTSTTPPGCWSSATPPPTSSSRPSPSSAPPAGSGRACSS